MKKSLLVAAVLLFGLSTFAQTSNNVQTMSPIKKTPPIFEGIPGSWISNPSQTTTQPKKQNHSKSIQSAVNAYSIGQMMNAFGMIGGIYQAVWADPRINSVVFIHRSAPLVNGDPIGGYLRYDRSKDGGATFEGKVEKVVLKGVEPKSSVSIKLTGPFVFDRKNRNDLNLL